MGKHRVQRANEQRERRARRLEQQAQMKKNAVRKATNAAKPKKMYVVYIEKGGLKR